jgi:transcriptional regulator with XRE-family HTH domain
VATKPHARIKLARRQLKLSQSDLARAVGVQRSAVSQWETEGGKNPSLKNLRRVAEIASVHFEWLATGRGAMALSKETNWESTETAHALLIVDGVETRMIDALRAVSVQSRLTLVELAEQMAALRSGGKRKTARRVAEDHG